MSYKLKFADEEAAMYLLALLPPNILGVPRQPRQDRQSTLDAFTPGSSLARPKYLLKSPDQNSKR